MDIAQPAAPRRPTPSAVATVSPTSTRCGFDRASQGTAGLAMTIRWLSIVSLIAFAKTHRYPVLPTKRAGAESATAVLHAGEPRRLRETIRRAAAGRTDPPDSPHRERRAHPLRVMGHRRSVR